MKEKKLPHTPRLILNKKTHHVVVKTMINISLQERASVVYIKEIIKEVENRYNITVYQFYHTTYRTLSEMLSALENQLIV